MAAMKKPTSSPDWLPEEDIIKETNNDKCQNLTLNIDGDEVGI